MFNEQHRKIPTIHRFYLCVKYNSMEMVTKQATKKLRNHTHLPHSNVHKLIFIFSPRALNRMSQCVYSAAIELHSVVAYGVQKHSKFVTHSLEFFESWSNFNFNQFRWFIHFIKLIAYHQMNETSRTLATRFKHVDEDLSRFKNCLNCLSINFKLMLWFSFIFQGCQMVLYLTINIISISGDQQRNFFQLIKPQPTSKEKEKQEQEEDQTKRKYSTWIQYENERTTEEFTEAIPTSATAEFITCAKTFGMCRCRCRCTSTVAVGFVGFFLFR